MLATPTWIIRMPANRYDVADAVALFNKVNEQDFAAAQWWQPDDAGDETGGLATPDRRPPVWPRTPGILSGPGGRGARSGPVVHPAARLWGAMARRS